MRCTFRRLASTHAARYLETGTPTGLTGLFTHPSPRSTLLYTYHSTLEALSKLPEYSLYRQSTEAITKHRMAIVASVEPPGFAAYVEKTKATIAAHPWAFADRDGDKYEVEKDGKKFLVVKPKPIRDELTEEWDGRKEGPLPLEGTRSEEERSRESMVPDSEVLFKLSEKIDALEKAVGLSQPSSLSPSPSSLSSSPPPPPPPLTLPPLSSPEIENLTELWTKLPEAMNNAIDGRDKSSIELEAEPQLTVEQ